MENIILVVDVIKGLRISDKELIWECLKTNKRVIYVFNKIDRIVLEL